MANWRYTIDISKVLHNDDDYPTVNDKGMELAKRIRAFRHFEEHSLYLNDIANEFEEVETVEQFDSVLDELYDWGDSETTPSGNAMHRNRLCWINTF